jgi:hypothetical protein
VDVDHHPAAVTTVRGRHLIASTTELDGDEAEKRVSDVLQVVYERRDVGGLEVASLTEWIVADDERAVIGSLEASNTRM